MGVIEITHNHGREMYALALEHAIAMIEITGENALPILKKNLEEAKSEGN